MSPLISAPNRGFADYQRTENWDTGALWTVQTGLTNAFTQSPVMDMSRFAYVGGRVQSSTNLVQLQFVWYQDAAATVQIASRSFTLAAAITNPCQLRVPNLGPFLVVTAFAIGGVNYVFSANLFATNRVHPLEFLPELPTLMYQSNVALGAFASVTVWPTDYYAGPLLIAVFATVATVQFVLSDVFIDGVTRTMDSLTPAANTWTRWVTIAPPGAWNMSVNNGAGAANFYVNIQYPVTGAS